MTNIKTIELNSGLKIIFIRDDHLSKNTILSGAVVNVGSNMETKKNKGVAHFLEHMLFRNKIKNNSVMEELVNTGTLLNGFTAFNKTVYHITSSVENLCICIDCLYSMFLNVDFTDKEVDLERRIILEEYSLRTPDVGLFNTMMYKKCFDDETTHNLINIIGSRDSIKKIDKSMLKSFKEYYDPGITDLYFIGNYDDVVLEVIINTVQKTFGTVKTNKNTVNRVLSKQYPAPKRFETVMLYAPVDSTLCSVYLGFQMTENIKKNMDAFIVMLDVVNNDLMPKILREDNGYTYFNNMYYHTIVEFVFITLYTNFKYLNNILRLLAAFIRGLKQELLDKRYIKNAIKRIALQNGAMDSTRIIREITLGDGITLIEELEKVTNKDINKLSADLFNPDRSCLIIIGPKINDTSSFLDVFEQI